MRLPAPNVRPQTNESGFYTVTNIPPGMYSVAAEASGFKKYEAKTTSSIPAPRWRVDVTLTVGAATETVEVSASAAGAADGVRHPCRPQSPANRSTRSN